MIVFLDSGPLGGITNPKSDSGQAVKVWMRATDAAGHQLLVPAIADYELRREHLLQGTTRSLTEVETFVGGVPGRYLPLCLHRFRPLK